MGQAFSAAMVKRFSNIEVKDQKNSDKPNLRNELSVIMMPTPIFDLYAEFIVEHSQGRLKNSDSGMSFCNEERWKASTTLYLNREFFKRLDGFNDSDFKALAVFLLNRTKKREQPYPKVIVKKNSIVKENTYGAKE